MLLTIHDANLKKVAFIDNEKQSTLHYFDDVWTRNLETGSSTFEFTVLKKPTDNTYNYLNEKAFVSFKYNGKSHVFNVMTVEESEQAITCYCENLNLELITEYANPYKASNAMTFVEYCNAMELLSFTYLSVGINEISDQKRTLEWDGQDTKLARLLSLAKKFDAEIDFDTQLNADSTIKSFKINVYHENDDTHQGVGRVRNDIQLTYGKNLKSITRKIDKTNVVNAIRPTGTKDGKTVVISGLSAWEEKNKDGVVEFYQNGEMLYATLSMQMYPSTFTSNTINDQWIRKDITVDSDDPVVIRSVGISELKKNAYPAITYDVDGFIDVEVGDTVKIYDDGFSPTLLIEARVADQRISFTNPDSNKTTFANFKALENRISDDMQARLNELVEQAKPYTIKLSTNNGVVFKNNIGQSIVTPTLYKGGKPVVSSVTWRWTLDGNVTTGMIYTVRGADVADTATLTVSAYIGNDEVATNEVSFVNVFDGAMGTPGTPGKDGRTPYVHTAWANNATGTSGFSLDNSTDKLYIGIYTDFEPADSTDPTKYKWTLIKGDKGADGVPGKDGVGIKSTVITYGLSAFDSTQPSTWTSTVPTLVKGQYLWTKTVWTYSDNTSETGYVKTYIAKDGNNGTDGLPGKDGVGIKSTAISYAWSSSGTTAPTSGWSTSVPTVSPGMFLWTKTVWTYSDNTSETGYSVARMGTDGAQGTPGPKGEDGKTSYHHWAYSNNADGTGLTLTDNGQRYMGYYTDYTQADSTDKTKYKWADRWAKIEVGGVNLLTGTDEETVFIATDPVTREFLRTPYDLAKVFDKHGLVTYTLSFDLKAEKSGPVYVYQQNGGGARYGGIDVSVYVTTEWKRYHVTFTPTEVNMELSESFLAFYGIYGTGVVPYARKFKLEKGTVATDWSPAPEDIQAEIDSKADQEKVVYKTDISVTDEGIVHSASKTVNGQTIASMIAQRAEWVEIIAKLLKVKGDMIVDGTIGANKLSVSTLSALTADLGQISGGSLELLKSEAQGTSVDAWGKFTIPAHKWGLYIDNIGAISSGTPVRKSSSESVASDMPVAVLASGELRFARVDQSNDLKSVLSHGLSDSDNASINFGVASDGTKQLTILANGQIVNRATNYTGWISTGVAGVFYKRQGDVVAIKLQVPTTANQTYDLGKIPSELVPIQNSGTMMRVASWTADQSFGRNLQINGDGTMSLLASNRGDTFNTQVTWII